MGQNVGQLPDPHRDPHVEMCGKGLESTGQEVLPSCPAFFAFFCSHDLLHEVSHGFRCFVLLLPGGVGVGAEGESSVVMAQHAGHRLDVYAVLQCQGCKGMSFAIMGADVHESCVF